MGIEVFDDFMETHGAELALEQNKLRQSLNLLKQQLEADPTEVSLDEIIQEGMGNCFELNSSSDFLDDTPWLIKALPFSSRPICNEEIPDAWERFLKDELSEKSICFLRYRWPILECIAGWYLSHLHEAGYDENDMVRRALAVFEYLIQILYVGESEECYREILTGNGLTILSGYCRLKDFERAKFYAELLRTEYLADRLNSEDYDQVKTIYDCILEFEHEDRASINKILELQWQTISAREKRIEELENRLNQIIKQESNKVDLGTAEKELKDKFGSTWMALYADTRKQLTLATAFAHQSISNEYPFVTPCCLFKALNSELSAKLFVPHGPLDKELLNKKNGCSEVMLLVNYGYSLFAMESEINSLIENALIVIGGKDQILTSQDLKHLDFLRKERNKAEHPKRPYARNDLQTLLRDVWRKDWLSNWLKRINQTA